MLIVNEMYILCQFQSKAKFTIYFYIAATKSWQVTQKLKPLRVTCFTQVESVKGITLVGHARLKPLTQ